MDIKIGDTVCVKKPVLDAYDENDNLYWNPIMNKYDGAVGTVSYIDEDNEAVQIYGFVDGCVKWIFRPHWLTKVEMEDEDIYIESGDFAALMNL